MPPKPLFRTRTPSRPRAAARVIPAAAQAAGLGSGTARVTWPVRAGTAPPPARAFTPRQDTVPGIGSLLTPGATVALVPGNDGAADAGNWPRSCGKTQLASGLAEALWQSGEVDLLVWVNAVSRASALSGYAEAAWRLGLDHGGDAESVAARFVSWLEGTSRRWLMVLDDLQDAAALETLWPGGPAGRVLITAASADVAAGWPGAVTVPVPAFSLREAMAFLLDRLSTDPEQRSGAYDLADRTGGEPAALSHASAVMNGSGAGCRAYERRLAQQQEQLHRAAGRRPPAAAVTWMLSADFAEELLPGGGTWPLLVLASLLDGHGIPRAALTAPAACKYLADAGAGSPPAPEHAWKAVLALERAGLVTVGPDSDPAAWVSTPLQAAVRTAAPPELLGRAVHAAADAVLEAWPDGQPRSWAADRMRACAASVARHARDALWDAGRCHPMLLKAGQSMSAARLAGPAADWWRATATRCERLLGGDHPDTLAAAGALADALLTAGQAADAVNCAQWALQGLSRLPGAGSPAVTAARVRLGRALAAAGRQQDALTVLREAAGNSGQDHEAGRPAPLGDFAAAFLAAGDTAAAVRFGQQALARCEQEHGPDGPATVAAVLRLAEACLADAHATAAVGHYKRALAAREQALGPGHPDTLAVRAGLAAACDAAGQVGDAVREHQRACAGYESLLGPEHPRTLACHAPLAGAYYNAGQLGDAVAVLRDSIARSELALSPSDPVTRESRRLLAGITDEMAGR